VRVNIDEVASSNSGAATGITATAISRNTAVKVNGKDYYRSVYRCALPLISTSVFNKEHFADIAGGGDFAGRGGETVNAMDPVDGLSGFQQVVAQFYVRSGAGIDLPIRGYEVYRAIGRDGFTKVATVNYATATTGKPFQYADRTPSLAAGDAYYWVKVFNGNPANNGYSQFSNVLSTKFLPPFTAQLSGPAHMGVSGKVWPRFTFDVTNPALVAAGATDGCASRSTSRTSTTTSRSSRCISG